MRMLATLFDNFKTHCLSLVTGSLRSVEPLPVFL
uniref:Uncharacterized protein n=1 Tax=Anguilla anguilla TaxID=7936 RepID=A0A0E9QQY8_ANGAN